MHPMPDEHDEDDDGLNFARGLWWAIKLEAAAITVAFVVWHLARGVYETW